MSELQAIEPGALTLPAGNSSEDSRYDGSRTPPDIQYEIMRRHKKEMPIATIAAQVGCDHRTVKAVIENWGNALHRLKLEAHKAQLIDNVILSWEESAKRGKSDSLRGWTDSLGITEPIKSQAQTQVGVQVVLHGGGIPEVSLAKVDVQSEGDQNQAGNKVGLISPLSLTVGIPPQDERTKGLSAPSVAQDVTPGVGAASGFAGSSQPRASTISRS